MMGHHRFAIKLYYELSLDQLVPQHHLLRRIAEVVDFSFIYAIAKPYYSYTGQPSIDPVVLFKVLLVGYLYGITSERRLMDEIHVNLAYRWFIGYDLDEPIPDHSGLSKARVRFGMDVFEAFFTKTVELCQAAGLVCGDASFVDSTYMRANAALSSLEAVTAHAPPLPPRQYTERLFEENPIEPGEQSEAPEVPALPTAPKRRRGRLKRPLANQRRRSRTDPDASVITHPTFGLHLAYKAHIAVDDHPARIITAAVATPGETGDEHVLGELLRQHRRRVGRLPQDVVADRRYGTLDFYRGLQEGGIRALIPDRSAKKLHPGKVWSIREFQYNPEIDTYTCPAGQTLARAHARPSERMIAYKAPPDVCQTCRFRSQCSPSGKPRGLRRSFDRRYLEAAQAWLETDEGRRRFKQRQVYVETMFALAKDLHGMRRTRWRGRWKVQIQVWLTASAMNLKKLAKNGGTDA